MSIFRLREKTPSIYVEKSRDFQLLCNAFDCINAGVRSEINGMTNTLDTQTCINRVIQLLQTKLGFFTTYDYNDDDIRMVLVGFAEMVKNKGSKKSIDEAISVFLRISKINTKGSVNIDPATHTLQINLETQPINTSILDEMLKYIVPTGYEIVYFFSKTYSADDAIFNPQNKVLGLRITNYLTGQVAKQDRSFIDGGVTIGQNYSNLYQMVGITEVVSYEDATMDNASTNVYIKENSFSDFEE